jgi:hypothetical protein
MKVTTRLHLIPKRPKRQGLRGRTRKQYLAMNNTTRLQNSYRSLYHAVSSADELYMVGNCTTSSQKYQMEGSVVTSFS